MKVGVRALRSDLSRWIDHARQGREVVITERGRPVARLIPYGGQSGLEQLIAAGLATPPQARRRAELDAPSVRPRGGSVSDILFQQRHGRGR